jgi:NADH:ubiquinone oxidoreductase subunit E
VSHGPSASGGALHAAPVHAHHDVPHEPVFVGARLTELQTIMSRYPSKMAALLPALWILQDERGWVSEDGMKEVAQHLELTPAYVKGVVSFYTMYHQHPVGKHFIQVCTTTPCNVCGRRRCRERIPTADGLW